MSDSGDKKHVPGKTEGGPVEALLREYLQSKRDEARGADVDRNRLEQVHKTLLKEFGDSQAKLDAAIRLYGIVEDMDASEAIKDAQN